MAKSFHLKNNSTDPGDKAFLEIKDTSSTDKTGEIVFLKEQVPLPDKLDLGSINFQALSSGNNVTFSQITGSNDVDGQLRFATHNGTGLQNNMVIESSGDVVILKDLTEIIQLGGDIDGEDADDRSGTSVSLSADGTIVAIGAPFNDNDNGNNSGHVRVYEFDATKFTADNNGPAGWNQLGGDIDGEAGGDQSGFLVSLSADGSKLAIGAPFHDDNKGQVRVFELNPSNTTVAPIGWTQLGGDIDGEAGESGTSVSLSADGTIVAIGAPRHDNSKGQVRVFELNPSNTTVAPIGWTQLGGDIDGEDGNDLSGRSVSLSADGTKVAIGASLNDNSNGFNSGHVRVYQFNATKTIADNNGPVGWNRLGGDIDGEAADDLSGTSVSLSADGSKLAIGAPALSGDDKKGQVRVFDILNVSMRVTNNGRVGIGTNLPEASLHIKEGGAIIDGGLILKNDLEVGGALEVNGTGTSSIGGALEVGGNVGIGTTNPAIQLALGDNDTGFQQHGDGELSIYTNNQQRMRIDTSGNVGIGTTEPQGKLHIFETTGTSIEQRTDRNPNRSSALILEHGNARGESSILFKSAINKGSDFGFIRYVDDGAANGGTAENSLLEIGVMNDGHNGNNDEIKFSVPGGSMYMRADGNVGIGTTNPVCKLHIKQAGDIDGSMEGDEQHLAALVIERADNTERWLINQTQSGNLMFAWYNGKNDLTNKVIFDRQRNDGFVVYRNFTGQHGCLLNKNISVSNVGLIVSSTGKYVNTDNLLDSTINESLPYCVITNTDNDKKVFGVISNKEDSGDDREYSSGNIISVMTKTNTNEERMFINSLGEGAIWVSNKNGSLENGDYISSSSVTGYGMKQTLHEEFLTRYTVAKITCDCDFSLDKIVKQKLKVITTTTSEKTTTEIDYDENGDVQYEDDLDSEGNQQMVYKYETRFLQADGTLLVDEADYNTRLANGESVYIACFVGCTYHCG